MIDSIICLACLIVCGMCALSMLLLQIRDACRLRNILKDYKESDCKAVRDAVAKREEDKVVRKNWRPY